MTKPTSEQGDGNPTPEPEETAAKKEGIYDGNPRRKIVDDYAERPYKDAVTKEHLEVLKSAGQEPV